MNQVNPMRKVIDNLVSLPDDQFNEELLKYSDTKFKKLWEDIVASPKKGV